MERIFEGDDRRTASISAGNFYRVFHAFDAAVHQQGLLRKTSRRAPVQFFRQPNVGIVRGHRKAKMAKTSQLFLCRLADCGRAVADIHATDAARKIEKRISIHIV